MRPSEQRGRGERRPVTEAPPGSVKAPPGFPRWLMEELTATTAPARLPKAVELASVLVTGADDPDVVRAAAFALRDAAPRSPTAREVAGLASYAAGRFADARADLMTYRRLTGERKHDVVIADCYRGEGRPDRAVELLADLPAADARARLQVAIIRAGAYADLGNKDGARAALHLAGIDDATIPNPGSVKISVRPSGPGPKKKR